MTHSELSLIVMECFMCGHEHFMGRQSYVFKLHSHGYWLPCDTEGCSCELGRRND